MQSANPAVIPRNHKVEEALEAAVDQNDLSVLHRLLAVLANPYDYTMERPDYQGPAGAEACEYETFCGT